MPENTSAPGSTSVTPIPAAVPTLALVLPEELPAGAQPIFLSSVTQKLFQLEADVDVTEERPGKKIDKKAILDDIFNRAAVSDFQPLRKQLESYSRAEVLLLYDIDFKFGQNFIICLTVSAMESISAPPVPVTEEGGREEGISVITDGTETLPPPSTCLYEPQSSMPMHIGHIFPSSPRVSIPIVAGEEGIAEEEEEVVYAEIPGTPPPRGPWVSQGSEKEVEEWKVTESRPRIRQRISRKRNNFSNPFFFSDRSSQQHKEMYAECETVPDETFSLPSLQTDKGVQAVPCLEDTPSQTSWTYPKNAVVQYSPRDSEDVDTDSSRIHEFILLHLDNLELALQQNLIMNIFIDDYLDLSAEGDALFSVKTDNSLKEYQSFTDLQFSKDKTITCLDWHPTVKGLLAVSCAYNLSFDKRVDALHHIVMNPSRVLIWSFVDPIHPMLMLEAPEDVACFKFNPINPNIIVGGCMNGYVVLWDISQWEERLMANRGTSSDSQPQGHKATAQAIFDMEDKLESAPVVRYCARSSIEQGHKSMVTDIQWLPSHLEVGRERENLGSFLDNQTHQCHQIVSSSLDGMVYFWDTRPLPSSKEAGSESDASLIHRVSNLPSTFSHLDTLWKPFLYVSLPRGDNPGDFGATRISLRERQHSGKLARQEASKSRQGGGGATEEGEKLPGKSSKLFVGTEDGEIVCTDWMPLKDGEGRFTPQKPEVSFSIHSGIVTSLNRSPFFNDLLLSVGGWSFCLWKEGVHDGPIFESSCSDVRRLSGCWSPSRPGVFFIGRSDGYLEVWDLMDKSHEPVMRQNVSSSSLTNMDPFSLTKDIMLLAIGDSSGTLHLLQVPWSLRHPSSTELALMESYWDRAVKALRYQRERESVREQEMKQIHADSFSKKDSKQAERSAEETEREYELYLSVERRLLKQLGLVAGEDEDI